MAKTRGPGGWASYNTNMDPDAAASGFSFRKGARVSVKCIRYQDRTGDSLRGVADLEVQIADIGAMEIKDFTVYEQGVGNVFVNPPVAKYAGGVSNLIRIRDRAHREKFRAAVLAAVAKFTESKSH